MSDKYFEEVLKAYVAKSDDKYIPANEKYFKNEWVDDKVVKRNSNKKGSKLEPTKNKCLIKL